MNLYQRHRARRHSQFKQPTQNIQVASKPQSSRLPIKRITVHYAHTSVSQLMITHGVRLIQKTHGKGVVRICARTVPQLRNTATILYPLINENLIEEVGMPLKYAYKMKSLVLFIKPQDQKATEIIESRFRNSGFNYHITVFDVKNPYLKEEEALKKPKAIKIEETNDEVPSVNQVLPKHSVKAADEVHIEEKYHFVLMGVIISSIFYLTHMFLMQS